MNRKIIAFAGGIGAGKSTAASILAEHGFIRMSFADPLYSIAERLHFKRIAVGGQKQKEEPFLLYYPDFGHSLWDALREVMQLQDKELAEIYGRILEALDPHLTYYTSYDALCISLRQLLITIGTSVRKVTPDYWADHLRRRLFRTTKNVTIDDVRYDNEEAMVRKIGGRVFRVSRSLVADAFADIHNVGTESDLRDKITDLLGV